MINFIIVDDNCMWREQVSSIIDKIMIKTDFEYNKNIFDEYDEIFNKYMENNLENKIYILDIKTNKKNGLDIARKVRKEDNDAIIIFLTAYEEYSSKILKSMLEVFCLISKQDNVEEILQQGILEILNRLKTQKNMIKIEGNTSICAIPLSKVLYITMDSKKRKAIIKTDIRDITCKKTLKDFEKEYKDILVRTHKSCLVNINRTIDFDFKKQKIYFNNKTAVELLSKKYKDKIKERIFLQDE